MKLFNFLTLGFWLDLFKPEPETKLDEALRMADLYYGRYEAAKFSGVDYQEDWNRYMKWCKEIRIELHKQGITTGDLDRDRQISRHHAAIPIVLIREARGTIPKKRIVETAQA